MALRVLYVEDEDEEYNKIHAAVNNSNGQYTGVHIFVEHESDPASLPERLPGAGYDIVLADMYFNKQPRLKDIITHVRAFNPRMPIIAYTNRGTTALQECLEEKDHLYDIWDKNSASPAYVAWRLSKLAVELARATPVSVSQRALRTNVAVGPSWRNSVNDIARRYALGLTEVDQLRKVTEPINTIASLLGVQDVCTPLWKTICAWEGYGRAIAPTSRGHARHAVNVYLLGYFLLNAPELAAFWQACWGGIAERRGIPQSMDHTDALNAAWFYAGIFHDAAYCLEKQRKLTSDLYHLYQVFPEATFSSHPPVPYAPDTLLSTFTEPLRGQIRAVMGDGTDHGAALATYLLHAVTIESQVPIVIEAARAIALHTLFSKMGSARLSWREEPLACLLILCDQLQAWDRETGKDETQFVRPERAELTTLAFDGENGKPQLTVSIDYMAPNAYQRAPDLHDDVLDELHAAIRERVIATFLRLDDRPFSFSPRFYFGGSLLEGISHPIPAEKCARR